MRSLLIMVCACTLLSATSIPVAWQGALYCSQVYNKDSEEWVRVPEFLFGELSATYFCLMGELAWRIDEIVIAGTARVVRFDAGAIYAFTPVEKNMLKVIVFNSKGVRVGEFMVTVIK